MSEQAEPGMAVGGINGGVGSGLHCTRDALPHVVNAHGQEIPGHWVFESDVETVVAPDPDGRDGIPGHWQFAPDPQAEPSTHGYADFDPGHPPPGTILLPAGQSALTYNGTPEDPPTVDVAPPQVFIPPQPPDVFTHHGQHVPGDWTFHPYTDGGDDGAHGYWDFQPDPDFHEDPSYQELGRELDPNTLPAGTVLYSPGHEAPPRFAPVDPGTEPTNIPALGDPPPIVFEDPGQSGPYPGGPIVAHGDYHTALGGAIPIANTLMPAAIGIDAPPTDLGGPADTGPLGGDVFAENLYHVDPPAGTAPGGDAGYDPGQYDVDANDYLYLHPSETEPGTEPETEPAGGTPGDAPTSWGDLTVSNIDHPDPLAGAEATGDAGYDPGQLDIGANDYLYFDAPDPSVGVGVDSSGFADPGPVAPGTADPGPVDYGIPADPGSVVDHSAAAPADFGADGM
ncbi:MAG: hypothetical protein QM662_00715 [Gordonia sp. (in: high G+C Gram-positive bacteria)]